jgi:S1-C subfamily serine protease
MTKRQIYFTSAVALFLLMFTLTCFALPQPFGEITRDKVIERYFAGQSIDLVEGIWTTMDNKYEFAIIKNTSDMYSGYDYLGIVTQTNGKQWECGEVKLLMKKTASGQLYTGSYFGSEKGVLGTKKKECGTTFKMASRNFIECYLPIGVYGSPIKQVFLRTYPEYDSTKETTIQTSGTGFFISSTLVVTNYHVVADAKEIQVTFQNETKLPAHIVAKDALNDVALLKVTGLENTAIPVIIGQPKENKDGTQVFTVGFPLSSQLETQAKIGQGIINSTTGVNDDIRMFQISIPIQPGNSGSPLYNSKGEVIGIVTATLNSSAFLREKGFIPQNVNYALKINYLINLLSMLPEEVKLAEAKSSLPQLDAVQITDLAKQSIVLVVTKR